MTPVMLTELLTKLGITGGQAARMLGVNSRTLYRWVAGERDIPAPAIRILLALDERPRNLKQWLLDFDETHPELANKPDTPA